MKGREGGFVFEKVGLHINLEEAISGFESDTDMCLEVSCQSDNGGGSDSVKFQSTWSRVVTKTYAETEWKTAEHGEIEFAVVAPS